MEIDPRPHSLVSLTFWVINWFDGF